MTAYRKRLAYGQLDEAERQARMDRINPRYVLRNYLAQQAIERAQDKDYREIDRLMSVLRRPYEEQEGMETYTQPAPDWAREIEVSCSS